LITTELKGNFKWSCGRCCLGSTCKWI